MDSLNLTEVLENVKQLAIKVGHLQMEHLGRADMAIDTKTTGIDLVTEIDKQSEKMILQFLRENYPDHAVLSEESGRTQGISEYLWVVDPLDGTTNYAQGLPVFAVSIALKHKDKTILGVVNVPGVNQMFTAIRGKGAFLNGQPIAVSTKHKLIECVLATGFPYDVASHPANNLNYFGHLLLKTRAIRRFGAAAYDLACVACGKFDGYWEMGLQPWDAAAGVLMVEEAGGKVVSFRNDRKISIVAGNETICNEVFAELRVVEGM